MSQGFMTTAMKEYNKCERAARRWPCRAYERALRSAYDKLGSRQKAYILDSVLLKTIRSLSEALASR
jgi:hypothetical protein